MGVAKPVVSGDDEEVGDLRFDSDTDIEMGVVNALFKHGRGKFEFADFVSAKRMFRNSLFWLSYSMSELFPEITRVESMSKVLVLQLLFDTYYLQKKLGGGQ